MCFSAEASFTAAVILGAVAYLSIRKTHCKKLYWLACIPLLFAFQQLFEGLLWLTVGQSDRLHFVAIGKYAFLFFALFVWPVWIPLALYIPEQIPWRKKVLGLFLLAGIIYDILLFWQLSTVWETQNPTVIVMGNTLRYALPIENRIINAWYYIAVTLLAPFISSLQWIRWFGTANIIGVVLAQYLYETSFISVWCFFAAWVSLILYIVLEPDHDQVLKKE